MAPFLHLEHVFDAKQGFKRPLEEGRLAVDNIVHVGVISRTATEVQLEASVVRSTNIHKEPVTVKLSLRPGQTAVEEKIVSVSCDCPGGACKQHCCKHAMAVIIYLERKDESEIEVLTCTQTKQVWDKVKDSTMNKFDPAPVSEFCCYPTTSTVYRRRVHDVNDELLQRLKAASLKCRPQSEAALFWSGEREPKAVVQVVTVTTPNPRMNSFFNDVVNNPYYLVNKIYELSKELLAQCSPAEREYYTTNIEVSTDEALQIFLGSTGQDNVTWDVARFGRVTGCPSYSLYTYYKNKTPDWDKKLMGVFEGGNHKNDAMITGNVMESHALRKYITEENKKQTGIYEAVNIGIVINPLLPWLGYSADGIIFTLKTERRDFMPL